MLMELDWIYDWQIIFKLFWNVHMALQFFIREQDITKDIFFYGAKYFQLDFITFDVILFSYLFHIQVIYSKATAIFFSFFYLNSEPANIYFQEK